MDVKKKSRTGTGGVGWIWQTSSDTGEGERKTESSLGHNGMGWQAVITLRSENQKGPTSKVRRRTLKTKGREVVPGSA